MFPRVANKVASSPSLSMLSISSSFSQQSTRRLTTTAAQSVLSKTPAFSFSKTASSRFYHSSNNRSYSLFAPANNAIDSTTLRSSLLHTRAISTRSTGSAFSSSSTTTNSGATAAAGAQQHSRLSLITRKYTSPSSSSSSSQAAAASSSSASTVTSTVVSTAKMPLSFHEEMTRVRFSYNWWKEWTIIMGVFAVTGSSTVMVVKPILRDVFKLDGSMKEGPWSFRIAYLCTTLPLYSCVLLTVATLAGRRPYFKKVVLRMWGRFLPKKALLRFQ